VSGKYIMAKAAEVFDNFRREILVCVEAGHLNRPLRSRGSRGQSRDRDSRHTAKR
jgi:hypothetical protein